MHIVPPAIPQLEPYLTVGPKKTVYLAGPITGLTYRQAAAGWREDVRGMLWEHIYPVSPLRGNHFLADVGKIDQNTAYDTPMGTAKGITDRDRHDVYTCDAILACFLDYDKLSMGTAIEFGWADAWHKPIVMVAEADNVNRHVMMTEMASYVVEDLEEAAWIINQLLTPGA